MIDWYLTRYTVTFIEPGVTLPDGLARPTGLTRTLPIEEFIPYVPNPPGFTWAATEIMGNHVLLKVNASPALHAQIAANARFTSLPNRLSNATVPANRRTAISNKLVSLGYTVSEVNATNWNMVALLTLMTSGASPVDPDATGRALRINPGRIQTRNWQGIDSEVPD